MQRARQRARQCDSIRRVGYITDGKQALTWVPDAEENDCPQLLPFKRLPTQDWNMNSEGLLFPMAVESHFEYCIGFEDDGSGIRWHFDTKQYPEARIFTYIEGQPFALTRVKDKVEFKALDSEDKNQVWTLVQENKRKRKQRAKTVRIEN